MKLLVILVLFLLLRFSSSMGITNDRTLIGSPAIPDFGVVFPGILHKELEICDASGLGNTTDAIDRNLLKTIPNIGNSGNTEYGDPLSAGMLKVLRNVVSKNQTPNNSLSGTNSGFSYNNQLQRYRAAMAIGVVPALITIIILFSFIIIICCRRCSHHYDDDRIVKLPKKKFLCGIFSSGTLCFLGILSMYLTRRLKFTQDTTLCGFSHIVTSLTNANQVESLTKKYLTKYFGTSQRLKYPVEINSTTPESFENSDIFKLQIILESLDIHRAYSLELLAYYQGLYHLDNFRDYLEDLEEPLKKIRAPLQLLYENLNSLETTTLDSLEKLRTVLYEVHGLGFLSSIAITIFSVIAIFYFAYRRKYKRRTPSYYIPIGLFIMGCLLALAVLSFAILMIIETLIISTYKEIQDPSYDFTLSLRPLNGKAVSQSAIKRFCDAATSGSYLKNFNTGLTPTGFSDKISPDFVVLPAWPSFLPENEPPELNFLAYVESLATYRIPVLISTARVLFEAYLSDTGPLFYQNMVHFFTDPKSDKYLLGLGLAEANSLHTAGLGLLSLSIWFVAVIVIVTLFLDSFKMLK